MYQLLRCFQLLFFFLFTIMVSNTNSLTNIVPLKTNTSSLNLFTNIHAYPRHRVHKLLVFLNMHNSN